jgi:hypothetical protein
MTVLLPRSSDAVVPLVVTNRVSARQRQSMIE